MKKLILPFMAIALLFSCRPQLGQGEYSDNKIIGGVTTDKFSAVVALTDQEMGQYCTGVAISPRIILTAAHCLQKTDGSFHHADTMGIYVGPGEKYGDYKGMHGVLEFFIHPEYDYKLHASKSIYDFGYIILERSLTLDEYIVPLRDKRQLKKVFGKRNTRQSVILMGYGTDENLVDGVKKVTNTYMTEVDEYDFQNNSMEKGDYLWSNSEEKGSCHGDSGGPAFLWIGDQIYLIGIAHSAMTKYGDGITDSLMGVSCHPFNTYGRIDIMMDWFFETEHGELYKEYLSSL